MEALRGTVTFIVLYGVSYGVLLFMISVGLVVTMGLMRVLNIAHGAFAAIGGYVTFGLIGRFGLAFPLAVLAALVVVAALAFIVERWLFASLYTASELPQVLLTIGVMFLAIASLNFFFGPNPLPTKMPAFMDGSVDVLGQQFPRYRLVVMAVGAVTIVLLWLIFDRTNFGARLKAAVDNRGMAEASGINVRWLFSAAFMLGSVLAALGGAIGFAILPLEPLYPLKYLTLVLIVVALTGLGNIKASPLVAILLGVVDTGCKYLLPGFGAYIVYVLLIGFLFWRDRRALRGWAV